MPKIRKILQIRQIRNQLLAVSDWLLAHANSILTIQLAAVAAAAFDAI